MKTNKQVKAMMASLMADDSYYDCINDCNVESGWFKELKSVTIFGDGGHFLDFNTEQFSVVNGDFA